MSNVGFDGAVSVSTDNFSSSDESLTGCNSVSANIGRAMQEVTDFDDTHVDRIAGLRDSSGNVAGTWKPTNAGQIILQDAADDGSDVYLKFTVDGTNGLLLQCKVESFEASGDPGSVWSFSASLQGVAAWTLGTP